MAAARRLTDAGIPFMIGQMNEGAAATAAALHVACATSPAFAELYGADGLIDDPVSGVSYTAGTAHAITHLASVSLSTLLPPTSSETSDMDNGGIRQGSDRRSRKRTTTSGVARARKLLSVAGIDVMVVTGPENIYYLTGQQTPGYYTFQALVLPAEGEPTFVVRQLEYFNFIANTFIANAEIYQDGDQPVNFLVNVIKARGWASKRIANRQARLVPSDRDL